MDYVEESIQAGGHISKMLIRELHQLTVDNLVREGDSTPGQYRAGNVQIGGAEHLPPDAALVPMLMQELADFINRDDPPKYDLLKMAIVHHRFCWIHPFGNGNGRTVRLLSYGVLIKYGFNVQAGGRVLNPTAVFCNDRNAYYAMLSEADKGTDEGLENGVYTSSATSATSLKKSTASPNTATCRKKFCGRRWFTEKRARNSPNKKKKCWRWLLPKAPSGPPTSMPFYPN